MGVGDLSARGVAGAGREVGVFSLKQELGGGWGRRRHLTARTNFFSLGGGSQRQPGQGESSAQLSPNGEVCKQKRGPRGSPARGRAARFSGIGAAGGEAGKGYDEGTQGRVFGTPAAPTSHCLHTRRIPL